MRIAWRCAAAVCVMGAAVQAAAPRVFWSSEPVKPDEAAMLAGSDLGKGAVQIERLDDGDGAASAWSDLKPLQRSGDTLKFLVPAGWKMGVYAVKLPGARAGVPGAVLLNAPDPWWVQGDEGAAATPGGWVRVMGRALAFDRAAKARFTPEKGDAVELAAQGKSDGYSLRFDVPAKMAAGRYRVSVSNGYGGAAAWSDAGTIDVIAPPAWPTTMFNVLEKDAAVKMRQSLSRYAEPVDRTKEIEVALKKAAAAGGGVVYFPAGKYAIRKPLVIPPRTVLRGEGEGLVVLSWASGRFNIDGGGDADAQSNTGEDAKFPGPILSGPSFGLEDLSVYLPRDYRMGVQSRDRLRMTRVRLRVDRWWMPHKERGKGKAIWPGHNFQVVNCDIAVLGTALRGDVDGVVAGNRIEASDAIFWMGAGKNLIVEGNEFRGLSPSAYTNLYGYSENVYFARNTQRTDFAHQADLSFTFDSTGGGYFGGIDHENGATVMLSSDPVFPKWAPPRHEVWKRVALCILSGRGAGQWRHVTAFSGRDWQVDRPFDPMPDKTSEVTIVPFNGRTLVIGNEFEDANWVNAGYGTSIDVVVADNHLRRVALMLNYGGYLHNTVQPSWHVEYLGNTIAEGLTRISISGGERKGTPYHGAVTRWTVVRGNVFDPDNFGGVTLDGPRLSDVIVERTTLVPQGGKVLVKQHADGVVLHDNRFGGGEPRYGGDALKTAVRVK